ncbi:MAG TPA: agmatinase [Methanobacterium sp.]|nr:agmatinase [Methanobacterium sp.]
MLLYTEDPLKFAFSLELEELTGSEPSLGILGVPFDGTASHIPGARFGPNAIREASYNLERFNFISNKDLKAKLFDLGNLQVVHGNLERTSHHLESTINELSDLKITPLILGGDHSISYSVLKALITDDVTVLHFDAHMDFRDTYQGEKFSHATVMRRIYELNPKKIIQVGIRSGSRGEVESARDAGIDCYHSSEVKNNLERIGNIISKIKGPIYITLDIDVLDPAYAPSVGTPCTGGLSPLELQNLVYNLKGKEIIGFDLVEVSSRCSGDITSLNAAQIIHDFICLY